MQCSCEKGHSYQWLRYRIHNTKLLDSGAFTLTCHCWCQLIHSAKASNAPNRSMAQLWALFANILMVHLVFHWHQSLRFGFAISLTYIPILVQLKSYKNNTYTNTHISLSIWAVTKGLHLIIVNTIGVFVCSLKAEKKKSSNRVTLVHFWLFTGTPNNDIYKSMLSSLLQTLYKQIHLEVKPWIMHVVIRWSNGFRQRIQHELSMKDTRDRRRVEQPKYLVRDFIE